MQVKKKYDSEYLFKHCDLSAILTLCDLWFGNNDQLKTTCSLSKVPILIRVILLMNYIKNHIFLALKLLELDHILSVKKRIQNPSFHEFAHSCGSICLGVMTLNISPFRRIQRPVHYFFSNNKIGMSFLNSHHS